jgi:hypothetical protein
MATSRKHQARALSTEERELVDKTHHPVLQELSDRDLAQLGALVRERRNRAQTEAFRQRREMRGKAEAKGARAAAGNTGTVLKGDVLAKAMRRLNAETERRRSLIANTALVTSAQKALEMKQAHEMHEPTFNSRTARDGMRNTPNRRGPDLVRPGERGRLRKANAVSQARRDSRPS